MPGLTNDVGRYQLLRELGRGGMATVYLARQVDLDRLVALKELGALRSGDPSFAQRFLHEARLAGALAHPNIVTVYDYFESNGVPYMAMEYLERGSLRPYVGRMSLPQIGGVLEGLLAGLANAGQHGIVHRDLKPENVMVTVDGRVKIADFGIAKATTKLRAGTLLTQTGLTVGTPNYIAPEQAMAQEVGPWTDLYSVGVMAFEFFTGRPPFADTDEPMGIVLRQINEPIPRLVDRIPSADPWISQWIEGLVAKDPGERPQSASEAWDGLEGRLIELLGPRWNRAARLLEPGEQPTVAVAAAAASGPRTTSRRLTAPLAGAAAARTAMPRTQLQDVGTTPNQPRRRRWSAIVAAFALAGVLAAVAGALVGGRGGGAATPQIEVAAPLVASTAATPETTSSTSTAGDTGLDAASLAEAAKSARTLVRQYDTSADQIDRLQVSRGQKPARARLVKALRQAAAAYRAVAAAADKGDTATYTAALVTAGEKRQAVQAALAEFGGDSSLPSSDSSNQDSSGDSSDSAGDCAGDSNSDDPSDDSCEP